MILNPTTIIVNDSEDGTWYGELPAAQPGQHTQIIDNLMGNLSEIRPFHQDISIDYSTMNNNQTPELN